MSVIFSQPAMSTLITLRHSQWLYSRLKAWNAAHHSVNSCLHDASLSECSLHAMSSHTPVSQSYKRRNILLSAVATVAYRQYCFRRSFFLSAHDFTLCYIKTVFSFSAFSSFISSAAIVHCV